jgi:hypothetical protein
MDPDWKDLEAIKRLKYKYMRSVDQKDWAGVRACFVPEATVAYSGGKYAYEGIEAIMGFLEGSMDRPSFHSAHRVTQPEIDFTSPTTADGIWALEDTVIDTKFQITIQGAAFYEDRYVKGDDGGWRILHTGYHRTFEEIFPRKSIEGLQLTASFWETGGQSKLDAG